MLKESDDLDISGVIFYSKMTFEKHIRSVSRTAAQRLGILKKSWRVFHMINRNSCEMLSVFCPACFGILFFNVVLGCL